VNIRSIRGRWVHSAAPEGGRRKAQHVLAVDADWDGPTGSGSRTVVGPDEALELCAQIEGKRVDHLLVSFSSPSGLFFAIGLGAPDSCAVYWESADPPYFQSHGAARDLGSVTYWYGGQDTAMPGSAHRQGDCLRCPGSVHEHRASPICDQLGRYLTPRGRRVRFDRPPPGGAAD
jgi:hypothetical protein